MDLEMRTWYGAPAYFVLGAVHAIVYWVTVSFLTPFILLVAFFNHRRRLLHDMLVGHHRHQQSRARRKRCARAAALSRARALRERASGKRFDGSRGARDPVRVGNASPLEIPVTQHSRNTPQFYLTAPSPVPLSAGPGGAQGVHPSGRRAGGRAQRPAHPWRLPPQPVDRLPAGLRDLPRLRLGAGGRRGFPPDPQHAAHPRPQRRSRSATCGSSVPTSEQYSVFRSYLDARHRDGGMADMTVLDYAMMVEDSHVETRMVEYRRRGPDSSINGRGSGRAARGRAHRRAQRRAVDGLLLLRTPTTPRARSAPS